jgi:hypothetical protein
MGIAAVESVLVYIGIPAPREVRNAHGQRSSFPLVGKVATEYIARLLANPSSPRSFFIRQLCK